MLVEAGVIQVLTYYRCEQALARTGNNAVVIVAIYHFSKGFLGVLDFLYDGMWTMSWNLRAVDRVRM